jgi:carboxylesterase
MSDSDTPGVFLVHGLGGTQYDLGAMHKHFKNHGFAVHSLTLPGHGTKPEDLVGVRTEDWLEVVTARYREALAQHATLHVIGMCLGSLIATEMVKRERHDRGRLVILSPPIYIEGWATPWYVGLRRLLYWVPALKARMRIEEEDPFGIKNDLIRSIVKAKFERGEAFHYPWVPLACIEQVDRLRAMVMRGLDAIACETLVIHAREDELTSPRSAEFLVQRIPRSRMIVLENSYHMVCVDNDRDLVAVETLKFYGVAEPRLVRHRVLEEEAAVPMSVTEIRTAAGRYFDELQAGRFEQLLPLFASEIVWHAGGPAAGEYAGRSQLIDYFTRLTQATDGKFRVTKVERVMIAGQMAAAWLRYVGAGGVELQGLQVLRMREGKIVELWGFDPDEAQDGVPDVAPVPAAVVPTPDEAVTRIRPDESLHGDGLKKRFDAAVAASHSLPARPTNEALLELYALFKQGTQGDAGGSRPGIADLVARAKYDAWKRLEGTTHEAAMRRYVALVESLSAQR